ncbi:hypothetical protein C0J52_25770, partial [Blattella germanica]
VNSIQTQVGLIGIHSVLEIRPLIVKLYQYDGYSSRNKGRRLLSNNECIGGNWGSQHSKVRPWQLEPWRHEGPPPRPPPRGPSPSRGVRRLQRSGEDTECTGTRRQGWPQYSMFPPPPEATRPQRRRQLQPRQGSALATHHMRLGPRLGSSPSSPGASPPSVAPSCIPPATQEAFPISSRYSSLSFALARKISTQTIIGIGTHGLYYYRFISVHLVIQFFIGNRIILRHYKLQDLNNGSLSLVVLMSPKFSHEVVLKLQTGKVGSNNVGLFYAQKRNMKKALTQLQIASLESLLKGSIQWSLPNKSAFQRRKKLSCVQNRAAMTQRKITGDRRFGALRYLVAGWYSVIVNLPRSVPPPHRRHSGASHIDSPAPPGRQVDRRARYPGNRCQNLDPSPCPISACGPNSHKPPSYKYNISKDEQKEKKKKNKKKKKKKKKEKKKKKKKSALI